MKDIIKNYIYNSEIAGEDGRKASKFTILKQGGNTLWIGAKNILNIAENFKGKDTLKMVFRDPKAANDIKGIVAQDAKGVMLTRVDGNVIVNTYLMTYGETWRKEFIFTIKEDLFDSYLNVASNNNSVDDVLAKERGPKSIANFGE